MADLEKEGVLFPANAGRRSTTSVGRETLAQAADPVDSILARRIRATKDWRSDYMGPARDLVAASAKSPDAAIEASRAGLTYLHESFEFGRGTVTQPLSEAIEAQTEDDLVTRSFVGGGSVDPRLTIPYGGSDLEGSDIRRQLTTWLGAGSVEPSFAEAFSALIDNPDWLDLTGVKIVLLGAGAEIDPLEHLLRWGAEVWAVDLPRPNVYERIIKSVAGTAGVLHVPVPTDAGIGPGSDASEVAAVAGADLIMAAPEVARWLSHIDGPYVIGNYGYADGALNVRLSMACDAISQFLMNDRPEIMLAFLATPTDAFQVPYEIVQYSKDAWKHHLLARFTKRPLKLANLFQPNYQRRAHTDSGKSVGVADCLVEQQGPNYLLAKRMQRWRASVSRSEGYRISLNVAPATRTQSVVKNKILAAAYVGAERFGIEVFEPHTCNAVMAALLVRDLRDPKAAANPDNQLDHPSALFVEAAAHGGLWRSPYDPRSVLGVAAVMGMFERAI